MAIEFIDRPPHGWFLVGVEKKNSRNWDWCAYMIDTDPEVVSGRPHWLNRAVGRCWVSIPGKHRNRDGAMTALQDMLATRH